VGRGSRRWTAAACTAAAAGSCTGSRRKQRCRRGSEEEEGGEKVQGLMWKFEKIQGLPCKVKFSIDLKL
jgi:hypothetical protein